MKVTIKKYTLESIYQEMAEFSHTTLGRVKRQMRAAGRVRTINPHDSNRIYAEAMARKQASTACKKRDNNRQP